MITGNNEEEFFFVPTFEVQRCVIIVRFLPFKSLRRGGGQGGLTQASEINRHQATYTGFLHRNAINNINSTHRHFIMCYNNKL